MAEFLRFARHGGKTLARESHEDSKREQPDVGLAQRQPDGGATHDALRLRLGV